MLRVQGEQNAESSLARVGAEGRPNFRMDLLECIQQALGVVLGEAGTPMLGESDPDPVLHFRSYRPFHLKLRCSTTHP